MARKKSRALKPEVSARAKANGPLLLVALERLLDFPSNQDSPELDLMEAISKAQRLVYKVRHDLDV